MKKERNDLKAGIFILVSIALIVAVVIGIKGLGRLLEPAQEPVIAFRLTDDIGGLRKGDEVRIGGFKVGIVRDIELVTPGDGQPPYIIVRCSVPAKFQIKEDARVTVQGTLTGTSWMNFEDLGTAAAAPLAPGQILAGRPGVMSTFLAGAGDAMTHISGAAQDVRQTTLPKVHETVEGYRLTAQHATALIKHVRAQINPIVERYFAVADTATDAAAQIRDVFGESKGDFKETVANLNAATGTVREKLPGILDQVDGTLTKVQSAIDSANHALEDVKHIAANTKDMTGSARSMLVGNRSKIDGMIASLKTTGDNLKHASAEIRRSPWRLLYKPAPGEVSNLNLYDSARQFAEGASSLNDAANALRDALQDPSITPDQVETLIERLDKSFSNFNAIEQELWRQVR